MAITEIALLPLQSDDILDEETSTAGKVHKEALELVLSQPGAQRVYWGQLKEDPSMLRWFVDWDELEDHESFMNSKSYNLCLELFGSIIDTGATAYHAQFFSQGPIDALSHKISPATEIVTMWFPTSYSNEDRNKVVENVKRFLSILEKEARGYKAWSGGWVDEEIENPESSEKATAYALMVGWSSVEAHKDFCETQTFKENISMILSLKDLMKIEAVHSCLTEVSRSD